MTVNFDFIFGTFLCILKFINSIVIGETRQKQQTNKQTKIKTNKKQNKHKQTNKRTNKRKNKT